MRSIFLQSRRINSSRALLLPRLSSSPSCSSLPRRFTFSVSSTTEPKPSDTTTSSHSSLLEPQPSPSSSQVPSTRRPRPPPLHSLSLSTPSTSPAGREASTPSTPSKHLRDRWWSQGKKENRRAQARALVERLRGDVGGEGGEGGVAASPSDVHSEATRLFRSISEFSGPTDEDIRLYSAIHVGASRSSAASAAVEEENKRRLRWLLALYTRRSDIKSESLVGSLRSVLHDRSFPEDLAWGAPLFRLFAVDLASGATNASEAVEIVEGLRRLSPFSFSESEFEELLQAIGRVEDWTTTTRNTFELPSFPTPVEPFSQPPLQSSPSISTAAAPSKSASTPTLTTIHKSTSSLSAPTPQKKTRRSTPSSSSLSNPSTTSASSPSSSSSHAFPPTQTEVELPTSPSPPSSSSSSTKASQEKLLQFCRVLHQAPPPSVDDVQFASDLFKAAYPTIHSAALSDQARVEILVRTLSYISRVSLRTPEEKKRFGGLACYFIAILKGCVLVDFDSFGPETKKEVLSLVERMITRGQVESLASLLYESQTRDFDEEELEVIRNARDRLHQDPNGGPSPTLPTFRDWEKGFGARLGERMEESLSSRSSNSTPQTGTDDAWLDRTKTALQESVPGRGTAAGLFQARLVEASSSSESLVVASELYTRYAPPDQRPPSEWRQHGDILVRMLLLFSNHRGETPPFHLLEPILRELKLLPPSFIPSTPSFPSFAIPLLPIASNLKGSILIVSSILEAQTIEPEAITETWTTFLNSVERHSHSPLPADIVGSQLFKLVDHSFSAEAGLALEDLIQMYLRRWRRAEKEGGNALKKEEKQFEELERLVKKKRKVEGMHWRASMFGTLMEAQVVVKKDWREVFRIWKDVQEGAGVDAKSVEMYLLACRETSSVDQAKLFFTAVQANPSMLPLLTPSNWSLFKSILFKAKDLPSLVESIVFQATSTEEETASPLAVEDLTIGVELAREVGGEEGKKAELKLKEVAGMDIFEAAVKRVEGSEGGREGKVVDAAIP